MDLENLSESEAQTIASDSKNEFHERLYSGDSAVKAAVEKAFASADPEREKRIHDEQRLTAGSNGPDAELTPELQRLKQKYSSQPGEQAGAQAPSAGSGPYYEPTQAEIEVTENLRQEWGRDYDANVQAGGQALRSIFPTMGHLEDFAARTGILNDHETLDTAMRLLVKLGKARK